MAYLKWQQKTLTEISPEAINGAYEEGFVFGRIGKGIMDQTRSLRIDLDRFQLSSENRRILKKTDGLQITNTGLPYFSYDWTIGKLGKDFYDTKFGEKTPALNRNGVSGSVFSANKIKELLTDRKKSNFNKLLLYKFEEKTIGYAICQETDEMLHYCYPFYELEFPMPNLGLGMMLRAIMWAKETNKKYIYLGSFQRPSDTYKLQFDGIEWFDGKEWKEDLEELKNVLQTP